MCARKKIISVTALRMETVNYWVSITYNAFRKLIIINILEAKNWLVDCDINTCIV